MTEELVRLERIVEGPRIIEKEEEVVKKVVRFKPKFVEVEVVQYV